MLCSSIIFVQNNTINLITNYILKILTFSHVIKIKILVLAIKLATPKNDTNL